MPGLFYFRGLWIFSSSFWNFASYFPVKKRSLESSKGHDPIKRKVSWALRLPLHMPLTVVCYKHVSIYIFCGLAHWSVITYDHYLQNGKMQHILPFSFANKWFESWEKLLSDLLCTICTIMYFSAFSSCLNSLTRKSFKMRSKPKTKK